MLHGRSKPAMPTTHHAARSSAQRLNGEWKSLFKRHRIPMSGNETIYGSGQIIIILCALKCHLM
jgi:hypothetical protein